MFELTRQTNPTLHQQSYYQVRDREYDEIEEDDRKNGISSPSSHSGIADEEAGNVKTLGTIRIVAASLFVLGVLLFVSIWTPVKLIEQASSPFARTVPYTAIDHPESVSPLWGSVSKPYPTGAFWTNLVVGKGEGAIGVYPYGVKTLDVGVQLSYGAFRRVVLKSSITDPFMNDLQVAFVEGVQSHAVETYDNVSVTMTYKADNNIGKMKVHLVKSSPFITFAYESATPMISSPLFKILNMESREFQGSPGKQYILTLGNGQKWLLYSSDPNNVFVWDGVSTIKASVPFKGFVRLAYLPVQSFEQGFAVLMKYVQRYPTGATITTTFPSVNTAVMTLQYNSVGNGPLLMLALPHHSTLLPSSMIESEVSKEVQTQYFPIYSIKGILKGVVGDCWKLTYNLPSIGWNYVLTDKFTTDQLDEIAMSLFTEVKTILPTGTDPYLFGKQMGRMARLALIADNLGIADARQQAIYSLETSIIPWLQSMNHDILHYDRTYGGIVPSYGVADKLQDFGSGWYSDHHFHFGYFAHVIAVLAKLDMPFYEANKPALDAFLRDICNTDPSDLDFPFVRHKDMFDGHSWASGLFQQGNGKGQESSSEAVNAYYGCALYGLAIGNIDFQRFAQLLTAMEIQSTQTYWHMSNDAVYDAIFASNRMVGNIGALDVTASTWFGSQVEFVHGINMMPLTPITSVLFDVPYVKTQYPVLAQALKKRNKATKSDQCSDYKACVDLGLTGKCCPTNGDVMLSCCDLTEVAISNEWKGYVYNNLAILNRDAAWNHLMEMEDFGMGNSRTNSLFWTASRGTPLLDYNISRQPDLPNVEPACAANSACSAIGMLGECCPTKTGLYLGCCPQK